MESSSSKRSLDNITNDYNRSGLFCFFGMLKDGTRRLNTCSDGSINKVSAISSDLELGR